MTEKKSHSRISVEQKKAIDAFVKDGKTTEKVTKIAKSVGVKDHQVRNYLKTKGVASVRGHKKGKKGPKVEKLTCEAINEKLQEAKKAVIKLEKQLAKALEREEDKFKKFRASLDIKIA